MATSTLNPNAPMFVPLPYCTVKDFSDEWWDLVRSSPWFRHFWIQQYNLDQLEQPLPNDAVFSNNSPKKGAREQDKLDLISLGGLKWRKPRGPAEVPKRWEKAPKIVNVRVNPRPIKQPR